MREEFKIKGEALWVVTDDAVIVKGKIISYDDIDKFIIVSSANSDTTGIARIICGETNEEVNWVYEDSLRVEGAIKLIEAKIGSQN